MPNLDIIYDVTAEVTWDKIKTDKQVIYQTTSLPSIVTFDAFYFYLWPKTLSFERHLGGKALATDHRVLPLMRIIYRLSLREGIISVAWTDYGEVKH